MVLCMLAAETAAFAYEYTLPVEENASMEDKNAKFLLDDNSAVSALTSTHNLIAPSGWDIDRRGGSFTNLRTAYYIIKDTSNCYPVNASYNFDKQINGQFTFETYLYFNTCEDGFYIEFTDDEANAPVKLYIEKGEWCSGGKKLAACEENVDQRIKIIVDLDKQTYLFALNGELISDNLPFVETVSSLEYLKISTTDENEADVNMGQTAIYKNYLIMDRFLAAPVGVLPYDWQVDTLSSNAVSIQDPLKTGVADTYSLCISDKSAADRIILTKNFETTDEKLCIQFTTLISEYPQNITFALKSKEDDVIRITTKNKEFYSGGSEIKSYSDKIWNKIRIEADPKTQTADIKINGKLTASIPFEKKRIPLIRFRLPLQCREGQKYGLTMLKRFQCMNTLIIQL